MSIGYNPKKKKQSYSHKNLKIIAQIRAPILIKTVVNGARALVDSRCHERIVALVSRRNGKSDGKLRPGNRAGVVSTTVTHI